MMIPKSNAQQLSCGYSNVQTLCSQFSEVNVPCLTSPIYTSQIPFPANDPQGWFNVTKCLNTTLIVDSEFEINNCVFKMGTNGLIKVVTGGELTLLNSEIFSCASTGWEGIRVEGFGQLTLEGNHIEDAQSAITIADKKAISFIRDNRFNRNDIGIKVAGVSANALVTGNAFECTSVTFTGDRSTAGVYLAEGSITVGVAAVNPVGNANSFNNQKMGIYATDATVRVRHSNFNCSTQHGIYVENSFLYISEVGNSGNLRCNFNTNQQDIMAVGSNLDITKGIFRNCLTDNIYSRNNTAAQSINISNNDIEIPLTQDVNVSKKSGIYLERSTGAVVNNIINDNLIRISAFNQGMARSAIRIVGAAGTTGTLDVLRNIITLGAGGNPSSANGNTNLYTTLIDYEVGPTSNANFVLNTVDVENDQIAALGFRWGFYIHDWESPGGADYTNDLRGNQIRGGEQELFDHGCCAMHWEQGGPWEIYANYTNNTLRGFHFNGTCGQSIFRNNTMGLHKRFPPVPPSTGSETAALILEPTAYLGPQYCERNRWLTNDYSPDWGGLLRNPTLVRLIANEFTYDPSQTVYNPNPKSPANGWFTPELGCPEEASSDEPEMALDLRERNIVQENLDYSPTTDVEEWEARMSVLVKLLRYPEMKEGDQEASTFFDQHIHTSAGIFAQWNEGLQQGKTMDAGLGQSLLQNTMEMHTLWQILDALTSESTESSVNILEQISTLNQQRNALLQQIKAEHSVQLESLNALINDMPNTLVFEKNQKTINRLKIKAAKGEAYDQQDHDALRKIARQCPEVAGAARSWAVHHLPFGDPDARLSDGPFTGDCEGLSHKSISDRFSDVHGQRITLSPNPAGANSTLDFGEPFTGIAAIYDLSGHLMMPELRIQNQQQVSLETKNVPTGSYWLRLVSETGDRISLRLIVAH
jgi:hypothetical protein